MNYQERKTLHNKLQKLRDAAQRSTQDNDQFISLAKRHIQTDAKKKYSRLLKQRWEILCELARKAGYKKITVGACKHWKDGSDSMIFAEPKKRLGSWPAIWEFSDIAFGRHGCGNGLPKADQVQLNFNLTEYRGEHKL